MINVVNQSTLVDNSQVHLMARACAAQMKLHAAPAWGIHPPPVVFRSSVEHCEPSSTVIAVLDDADQANALGWHTEDAGGLTYGRVFAAPVLDNGGAVLLVTHPGDTTTATVSSVLSHEVLEAAIDPSCNRWCADAEGVLWALEIADPVESEFYSVQVSNTWIAVSDFVLPAWFDPNVVGRPTSYLDLAPGPFEVAVGGYAVKLVQGKEREVYGAHYPAWRKSSKRHDTARTARRMAINAVD